MTQTFKALVVSETPEGKFSTSILSRKPDELPQNETLIKVKFSSLNYKDALSASGNKGVTRYYPHTPGIDAAGVVVSCITGNFKPGDEVIVTGYDLGMNTPGGFGEYISVPSGWVVPLPEQLSLEESMILGTAGFTAALSLYHLLRCGQSPSDGPVLVTGATGGVGSLAVALLANAGFEVIASTGKLSQYEYLYMLGATTILSRDVTDDQSKRALLKARWAGAVDTVGGNTLATVLKACKMHGNVACCGNVQSPELHTTVFPFILNGITLIGVNSADTPMQLRTSIWKRLATSWKIDKLHSICRLVNLEELPLMIDEMLNGKITGRIVLKHD
ncbi:MAG TPA: YhdH/YhfP family quinone oxidoreductase [Bacteroidales bacterium]|nr:YhdH/YhfP family quinone oxidoreductase [Bacteroidales bacterium]